MEALQKRLRRQEQNTHAHQHYDGNDGFSQVNRILCNIIMKAALRGLAEQDANDQKQCRAVQKYNRQVREAQEP